MEKNLIKDKLFLLMKKELGIEKLHISQNMEDIPEWDSLKHIQLLVSIEEKFSIEIDFEESISMVDIKTILDVVTAKLIK